MKSKQIIVMRTDLNMRKGKMIAQGSHASMKVILDLMSNDVYDDGTIYRSLLINNEAHIEPQIAKGALKDWLEGEFTKICVKVNSEEELQEIYDKAKEAGLLCSMIVDSGHTEFNGVPTKTCCAIGPNWSSDIDPITKHLQLL